MEKSLFFQYVSKWFGPIITKIVETVNGTKEAPTYLHKVMLRKLYSPTLKWGSLSSNGSIVSADVVAMDTSLPLKKRDSIAKAEGDIPKLGMKLYLNERTMTDLDILQRSNANGERTNAIIAALFADTKKCITGISERLEAMFLEAYSTGQTVIEDENNTGVGIRIDFGHPDKNKFGVGKPWSDADATPITDIENVLNNASGNGDTISFIFMDRATWNNFRAKADVKDLFAAQLGFAGAKIPAPTLIQANNFLGDNYGITIQIIDRTVVFEKNGKRTKVKPWAANVAVFATSLEAGTLTYGTLAEENHKAKQVEYQKADDFILLSKYHKNDPLREFTSSQALVLPVIDNVDSIYIVDTEEAATDAQTEDDANFDYEGTSYTKASVVAGLNATKEVPVATTEQADSTLLGKINKLSEAGIEIFEAELVAAV